MSMKIDANYNSDLSMKLKNDLQKKEKSETSKAANNKATNEAKVESSPASKKNEKALSKKAQEFLAKLREQYSDYDFFVGNGPDEIKGLSGSGSKEISVIFSNAELERMANDEEYAKEKLEGVEGAVKMTKKIAEENGFASLLEKMDGTNGTLNRLSIAVDDSGTMKLFAELEKSSDKNAGTNFVKRVSLEATSIEDLATQMASIDWTKVKDSHSGDKFDLQA